MKNITILLLSIILLLTVSCSGASESGESGRVDLELTPITDIAQYIIVRGDTSPKIETDAMLAVKNALNDALGLDMAINTDWLKKGDTPPEKELLIGKTNRAEAEGMADGLRSADFRIAQKGSKLIVVAGGDEGYKSAVDFIKNNLIDSKKGVFSMPKSGEYLYKKEYLFDSISIDGIDLSELELMSDSYDLTEMQAWIADNTGYFLGVTKSELSGKHYIKVDQRGFIADEYTIEISGGNITIKASPKSTDAAVKYFLEEFLGKSATKTLELTAANNYKGSIGKREMYTKEQLMKLLTEVYNNPNECIIGGEDYRSLTGLVDKFVDATGEKPGIVGIDLSVYGYSLMEINDIQMAKYICDVVDYCADGGIVTISSHFANPSGNIASGGNMRGNLGYDDTKEGYEKAFADLITEGTELNKKFKKELDRDAQFLKALGDNGIPVLWRPLHEQNGNWFWFCTTQKGKTMDSSAIRNLWIYIYDYYMNELKLDNLIWVFSPNVSSNLTDKPGGTMSTTYCYPGDEYVDMVGCDWYSSGKLELATNGYKELIDKSKMIGAITEFGPTGAILADKEKGTVQADLYDSMDLYDDLIELRDKGFKFSYLLTWTDKWSIPAMTRGDEFMQTEYTLGQADVAARFAKMK